MKALFLYNPESGRGNFEKYFPKIKNELASSFEEMLFLTLENKEKARDVYQNIVPKYDALILIGGDGTLHFAINEIMKLTGINNSFYLYNSFNSSKNKVNLKSHILSDGGPCLYLKNDNGILESLFFCLRNSLSHGDVIYRNGYYEFFSVKKENKDDYEIDGRVVFYMKIKSINQLKGFLCIEKYL